MRHEFMPMPAPVQRSVHKPGRNARTNATLPSVTSSPQQQSLAAAPSDPMEAMLQALGEMTAMVSQNEQRMSDLVTEIRADVNDEVGRLWRALELKKAAPPPGASEAEASWHRVHTRKLMAVEAAVAAKEEETEALRRRLMELEGGGGGVRGGGGGGRRVLGDAEAATRVQAHARGRRARMQGGGGGGGRVAASFSGRGSPVNERRAARGGMPFRAEATPSRFVSQRAPTPPSDKLDRALAAREAALMREAAEFDGAGPLSLLPRLPSSLLPPVWLPRIEEGSASQSVREAMAEMGTGLQALLDGGDENDEEERDAASGSGGGGGGVDAEAREVFDRFDADHSGTIEATELEAVLMQLVGLSAGQAAEYAKAVFKRLDGADGQVDGRIGWKAFRAFYRRCLGTEAARKQLASTALAKAAKSEATRERARAAFARFDRDGSGFIDRDELSALLREALGTVAATITGGDWEALVADALRRGDKDSSGAWEVGEFEVFFAQCLADEKLVAAYGRKLVLRFSEETGRMTALSTL